MKKENKTQSIESIQTAIVDRTGKKPAGDRALSMIVVEMKQTAPVIGGDLRTAEFEVVRRDRKRVQNITIGKKFVTGFVKKNGELWKVWMHRPGRIARKANLLAPTTVWVDMVNPVMAPWMTTEAN